jgi:hypothetical protein
MTEFLLFLGHRVRVLDNLSQGRREWVPETAEFLEGRRGGCLPARSKLKYLLFRFTERCPLGPEH